MNIEIELVKQLGDQIGYGHLMCIASALWRKDLKENYPGTEGGAFIPALFCDLEENEETKQMYKNDNDYYDKYLSKE